MASSTLPKTQKAVIAGPTGDYLVSTTCPVIEVEDETIIIKTAAVALNPVDTKMLGDFITPGAIFGFDCAGTVVAVGSKVTKDLKVGDRVCGSADGMSGQRPLGGAFAEYVSLPGPLALKVPDSMTFEQAAALGTGLASASMALFYSLGLDPRLIEKPATPEESFPVLIYGGASATGTMAIQLLTLAGLEAITTCSPKNFDFVKSYGAKTAFDYRSPTCGADIRTYTKNCLDYCFDCITQESTMKICYQAIGRAGGSYTALDPYPEKTNTRKAVTADWVLATKIMGRGSTWPAPYGCDGDPNLPIFAVPFYESLQKLLDAGKIKPHPQRLIPGGLDAITTGVGMVRRGEVAGEKLIFTL